MKDFQYDFLRFCVEQDILQFGRFTLKSGRQSPFFFNIGRCCTSHALARLGQFLAQALVESGVHCDMLFGPAYKGIPLVTATAIALSRDHDRDLPWCFNRKEIKSHGEKGELVGSPLAGRVAIVDDVITAGTAMRESVARIGQAGALPRCALVCMDRQECGQGQQSATQQIESDNEGMAVVSIVTLSQLLTFTEESPELQQHRSAVEAYIKDYSGQ